MKKKFTFLAFLLCLLCGLNTSQIMAQETIPIGDEDNATLNMGIPFDIWGKKNICQQLFTADEINHTSGTINSLAIKFQGDGSSATYDRKVAVYINNTDLQALSHSESIPSSQVANFDGTITFAPNEWAEFVFTTPFEYTGGNIIVTMYDYSGYSSGGGTYNFYVNSVQEGRVVFINTYTGDATNFASFSAIPTTDRNIMKFTFADSGSSEPEEGGDVVIGDENSIVPWSTLPLDLYYSYYVSQQLFTSDEIKNTSGGTISSIAVKFFGETNSGTASSTDTPSSTIFSRDVEVYISSTDLDNLTGGVNLASNQTANFDGTVTFTPGEWTEFEFTTPYLYDGGNIIITMYDKTGESGTGNYTHFYAESISGRAIQSGSESTSYSLTSDLANIGNTVTYRNQMQIKFDDSAPKPFSLTASAAKETIYEDETVKLTAKAKGGSGNYTYSWSPATGLDDATIANPTFTPSAAGTYTFTCTVNDGETTADASVTVNVEERPAAPATAPVVTAVADGSSAITLSWNAVNGAEWYDIYVDGPGASHAKNVYATEYTFTGLQANTEYCFIINAVNVGGESPDSDQVCIKTDRIKQYRVKITSGSYANQYLHVNSYTMSTSNKTNVGYSAYAEDEVKQIFTLESAGIDNQYYLCSDGKYIKCNAYNSWNVDAYSSTVKTALLFEYTNGENFKIRDTEKSGNNYFEAQSSGVYSNASSANGTIWTLEEVVVLEPAIPTGLTATPLSDSKILLEWEAAENALSYNVYRDGYLIDYTTETTYTAYGLNENTEYCFKVKATRNTKVSDFSNEACATTTGPTVPDEAAVLVATAATDAATITLTWNEVPKTTSYNIYQDGELIANTEETTYTVEGLELDATYCYTIKAVNEIGESALASNEDCATTYDGSITVTIGEGGSTNNYLPTTAFYNYACTQQIYTKDELGLNACEISNISFEATSNSSQTRKLEIYMLNTSKNSFSDSYDWVNLSASNKVFDGTFTFTYGWSEITLDTEFSYDGQNILICVIDKTGSYSSNYPFRTNTTTNNQALYACNDGAAYNLSNLSEKTGTPTNKNNLIKLNYKPTPASVDANPEEIVFNDVKGGNYWTEKNNIQTENITLIAKNTTISNISLSDTSFFTIPANIDLSNNIVELSISHKANPTAGNKSANLVVTYAEGVKYIPLSATVYAPVAPDVFELAKEADLSSGSYTDTPVFANLHDDYILPNEEDGNAPDAVYRFTLDKDVLLSATVSGTNGNFAIYRIDDLAGEGPTSTNNYKPNGNESPNLFGYDFNDSNLGDFHMVEYDDNNDDNWQIESNAGPDGSNCLVSYSYTSSGVTNADNYIITNSTYNIADGTKLSLDVACGGEYKGNYDKIIVKVSTDGEVFTPIETIDPQTTEWTNVIVDLGAKFNELGLAYGNYYIALHHYQPSDIYYIFVDNLILSEEADIEGDIYLAGEYYLIAAAEDAFTVNITKTSLPEPEAITYTSPADGATDQVNPVLSFELGKYTTEYQVLFGETDPPAVIKDWTAVTKSEYINSFQTEGLEDNKKYYWQIKARNSSGEKPGVVYSFTTPLNKPTNVVISDTEIFSDEETTITWEEAEGALYYNVYVDGDDERHNNANITGTSYVLSGLSRRIDPGYDVTVTAVHELGESSHTEPINVKVSGYCDLTITVVNTTDVALEGAELRLYGINEFGETVNYGPLTTDENGQVSQRVNMLKSGESYYVNVVKAPYTTITDSALIPYDYLLYGNYQFTITMNLPAPANFRAENDKIYEGDDVVLHWDEVAGATAYNVYVDGVLNAEVSGTTHTISGLAYNPTGYNVTVTTMLPEGESIHSDAVLVKVGGTFTLTINVTDNNENPLEGAAVVMTLDEYSCLTDAIDNNLQTSYELTTDSEGKVNVEMPLFKEEYTLYNVAVSKEHYEDGSALLFYYGNDYPDAAFRTKGGVYELTCTLSLGAPENFAANHKYYIEGGSATLTWDVIDADNLLGYNVYYEERDEETYEQTYILLNDELITSHRFVVENLEYGYQTYCLTAVYDLGESPKAYTQVQVTGYGSISGIVTDESSNPISGATVMITGKDQFEDDQSYILYTDANGRFFSNEIMPSYWDVNYQYTATVSKADYFNNYYSPIYVEYGVVTNIEPIVLQAKPSVTFNVTATLSEDYNGDEYVDITWENVENAERYNVYRKDLSNDQVTQLNEYNITWTNHSDNNWMTLPNGDYQYGVSAFIKNVTAESFEDGVIPAGWSLEADLVTKDWAIYDNTASYIEPRTGNYAIYRNGDHNDSGYANHIIMAPIDMTEVDNATLSFYYVNVNSQSGGEWVNTLKVSAREFGTDNWNELYSTNYQVSSWSEVNIELGEYAGKIVEVRFSASSNYAQYVAIDDITVTLPSEESMINWSNTLTKEGIEFTGIGDWNTPSNWNTGAVPGEEDHVAIRGNAVIDEDVTVRTLTIIEGGSLTVESGKLTATEGIVNNIASAFVIEDGAQVNQTKNDVKATFRMTVEAPTSWDSENNEEGWQFIASPMKNVKTSSFETDGTDFDLFKYDGEKAMQWVNYKGHNEDVISGETHLFDFTDGFDGWGFIDANSDGYSWGHNLNLTDVFHSEYMMGGRPEGYDDAGCLFNEAQWYDLDTYTQVNVSPDDYLVAPYMMNIGKYSALRFKMKGYSSMTETPEISVLVSLEDKATGEYVPADFTTVGIAPQINAVWEEVIISLEEYAGENVRVAIRHNVQDSWNTAVLIDKVELANIGFETEFQQGRGYLASYETTSTVEFAGVLSNETGFTFNEVNTFNEDDYYANFYLLGNPFAFNMNWENVTAEGLASGYSFVALDGSYDYAVDGEIKVGDGFFVKVTSENPSLSYSENNGMGMRSRRAEKSSFINLIASGKAGSDNVIINFAGNEEEGFAKLENFNKDIAEIYVKGEGRRYGIMNFEKDVEEIEVYFDAKRMGEYTIEAVAEGKFQSVVLVDRSTGVETELLTDSYTFKALTNDRPDRFVIRMSNNIANDNFVYQSGDELIINAEGTVEIIDIMGRIVYSSNIVNENHRVNTSRFDNAAYIVRVLNTNKIKTQKVVIY